MANSKKPKNKKKTMKQEIKVKTSQKSKVKVIVAMVGAVLAYSAVLAAAVLMSPTGVQKKTSVVQKDIEQSVISITEHSSRGLTLHFSKPSLLMETTDEACQIPSIEEQRYTSHIGQPQLPVIRKLLIVPPGAEVSLAITHFEEELLDVGYDICPLQEPVPDCECEGVCPIPEYEKDERFYNTDIFSPNEESIVTISEQGTFRDYDYIAIEYKPFRYNPKTKQMKAVTNVEVELEFTGMKVASSKKRGAAFDKLYDSLFLNALDIDATFVNPHVPLRSSNGADYIIIMPFEDYQDELAPLVALKEDMGLVVETKYVSDIVNEYGGEGAPERIRNYIKDVYDNGAITPSYVLLVGDVDRIQPKLYTQDCWEPGDPDLISDHFFSLLSGDDIAPEVHIGRLSGSEAEIGLMVDRIVSYQTDPPEGDWQKSLMLYAHPEGAPESFHGCKQYINQNYVYGYNKIYAYPYWGATKQDVIDTINGDNIVDGVSIINYRGHGGWYDINKNDVTELQNGSKRPVVFDIACTDSQIDAELDSFGELWLKNLNGGAIAHIGATRLSPHDQNNEFDKYLFKGIFDMGVSNMGDIMNYAKMRMGDNCFENILVHEYLLLGDPHTPLFTPEHQEHNLGITSFSIPIGPDHDASEPVDINYVVKNLGQHTESTSVQLLFEQEVIDSKPITSLGVGSDRSGSFSFIPEDYGENGTLAFYLVPVVGENLLYDNTKEKQYSISPITLTGVYSDVGYDEDGDGLYDSVIVDVEVDITRELNYRLEGRVLVNEDPYDRTFATAEGTLNPGIQIIQLRFPGNEIVAYDVQDTLTLNFLELYDLDFSSSDPIVLEDRNIYITNYYDYLDFEESPIELTHNFDDYPVDEDEDGLYEYLIIEAEVDVREPGDYKLSGGLNAYGGYTIHNFSTEYQHFEVPGTYNLEVIIDGGAISESGFDGPYHVLKMKIWQGHSLFDFCDNCHTTAPYQADDFIPMPPDPLGMGDNFYEDTEDTDGDGLINTLLVGVSIHVYTAGDYRIEGDLLVGSIEIQGNSEIKHYEYGTTIFWIPFSGSEIFDLGIDSPYQLKEIELYDAADEKWLDEDMDYLVVDYVSEEFDPEHYCECGDGNYCPEEEVCELGMAAEGLCFINLGFEQQCYPQVQTDDPDPKGLYSGVPALCYPIYGNVTKPCVDCTGWGEEDWSQCRICTAVELENNPDRIFVNSDECRYLPHWSDEWIDAPWRIWDPKDAKYPSDDASDNPPTE